MEQELREVKDGERKKNDGRIYLQPIARHKFPELMVQLSVSVIRSVALRVSWRRDCTCCTWEHIRLGVRLCTQLQQY